MRNIEGYVCVVNIPNLCDKSIPRMFLFGEPIEFADGFYNNFRGNGLIPYGSLSNAEKGLKDLTKRFESVEIKKLKMNLAESNEEIFSFEKKKSMIVVRLDEFDAILIGPRVNEGFSRYPLYGEELSTNGFKQFNDFEKAFYVCSEEIRQSQCKSVLSTFSLKNLATKVFQL
ncbi:MAG: hypothetical protein AABX88_03325 [Nanoarchaeota archaeon]